MLYLSNDDVQQVLDMTATIEALQIGYSDLEQGDAAYIPRVDLYAPTGRSNDYYRWGSMTGACRTYGVVAVRIKSDVVFWPDGKTEEKYCIEPGKYSGIILLYSIRNGEPLALINDGYLQHMRVGGGAGIGTDYMAREDAETLGLLGSGGMADTYLQAISQVRDLKQVKVYSPTKVNREHFAQDMTERLGLNIEPVETAEAAVRGADIVASATDAVKPTFRAEWLEAGTHIVNLSPMEVGQDLIDRADTILQIGFSTIPSTAQVPGVDYAVGGIAAYITGRPEERARIPVTRGKEQHKYPLMFEYGKNRAKGRTDSEEITMFLNVGTQGLQFASVAGRVYQLACKGGLGEGMPQEWFLQDIRD